MDEWWRGRNEDIKQGTRMSESRDEEGGRRGHNRTPVPISTHSLYRRAGKSESEGEKGERERERGRKRRREVWRDERRVKSD
ncbi:hypothetical protein E2C01_059380 [Portunus trituberculatus]|uniref:Uncharacterized protein n=1 Tax=Portunus trituberculatus TaxID=210409 RepID=A0A5B7H7E4_PORTR|nr:hypothetical protein [Portunus trituberculatus]